MFSPLVSPVESEQSSFHKESMMNGFRNRLGCFALSLAIPMVALGCGDDCDCPDGGAQCADAVVADTTSELPQDNGMELAPDVLADLREADAVTDAALDTPDSADVVPDTGSMEPVYWTAGATKTIEFDNFVTVGRKEFFGIGMHASPGKSYDGVTGPGECDRDTGRGYVDINIGKTRAGAAAGANFVYLWGYNERTTEILDVTPRFHGIFHRNYGTSPAPEDDVVPIIYNAFGESDMDGYSEERIAEMSSEFGEFITRSGKYSIESMPNLPPIEQVGHMSWHPTFRMRGGGDGKGEVLPDWQVAEFAKTTNMMIGDAYAYVSNRWDTNDPDEALTAIITGQIGDIGEGYDHWIETDDEAHRSYFDSGFTLAESLVRNRNPDAVVWMWLQGYAFGNSIKEAECEGEYSDSWAAGTLPPLDYLIKETLSVIAAGATGIVFFGYPSTSGPEAEIMHTIFRGLSFPEVYEPALLSPRLDMGVNTTFMGEEGYDGRGRAHLAVKWDEAGRQAFIIGANPGARATTVELEFPWSVAKVELLDWNVPRFRPTERVEVRNRKLLWTFDRDEGMLMRVTPLAAPAGSDD